MWNSRPDHEKENDGDYILYGLHNEIPFLLNTILADSLLVCDTHLLVIARLIMSSIMYSSIAASSFGVAVGLLYRYLPYSIF